MVILEEMCLIFLIVKVVLELKYHGEMLTTSLRWNHLFSEKLFMNTSLIFTDYRFEFNIAQSDFELRIFSGINDWNSKTDFLYIPNQKHKIKFGTNFTYHIFTPGNVLEDLER